jgi:hypothetical protein
MITLSNFVGICAVQFTLSRFGLLQRYLLWSLHLVIALHTSYKTCFVVYFQQYKSVHYFPAARGKNSSGFLNPQQEYFLAFPQEMLSLLSTIVVQ